MNAFSAQLARAPWAAAIAAMFAMQLAAALSVDVIDQVGAGGAAWLRLGFGALIFLGLARPPIRRIGRRDVAPLVGLGIASGLMTIAFLSAIERLPLGTTVAIEFLGPLTVAAVRSRTLRAAVWPVLALAGVVAMTEPWTGDADLIGIGWAVLAAIGWGTYIVLTQRVGDRFSGVDGLSVTVPIAALVATAIGAPQAWGHLDLNVVLISLGLAVLAPVAVFGLEMLALRHMTHHAFGTLMAIEPAFGLLLGAVVLHQIPNLTQLAGISLVIVAATLAQRGGRRTDPVGGPLATAKDV